MVKILKRLAHMKTFVGMLLLIIWPSLIFGQSLYPTAFQKGSVLLGSELVIGWGETNSNGYNFSTTSLTIVPKAALFLTNGLAVGIATDYTATKFNEYSFDVSANDFSIGPLIRVYSFDGFFAQSSFTFGKITKGFDEPRIRKFTLGVGYAFSVSQVVFIEPVIEYRNRKFEIDSQYSNDQIEMALNEFIVAIGIGIYIQKKP